MGIKDDVVTALKWAAVFVIYVVLMNILPPFWQGVIVGILLAYAFYTLRSTLERQVIDLAHIIPEDNGRDISDEIRRLMGDADNNDRQP